MSENVARITTDPMDAPIYSVKRSNGKLMRVGWLNEKGVCVSAGLGPKSQKNSLENKATIRLLVAGLPSDEMLEWIPYEHGDDPPEGAVYTTPQINTPSDKESDPA